MEVLAVLAAVVISCVVIAGILYIAFKIEQKVTRRNIKKLTRNHERLNEANRVICRSKEGSVVKLDVLRGKDEKFAELTVTGSSAAHTVRPGMEMRV